MHAASRPASCVPPSPPPTAVPDAAREFLHRLLCTPSPSGAEQAVQHAVRDYLADVADAVEVDLHGNLELVRNPGAPRRVMLAGHCDQIGFMVRHVTKGGFVTVEPIGGIDESVLVGAHVTIHAADGPVHGVIGKKPVHLESAAERSTVANPETRWIDIGARDRDEALARIEVGDYVTYRLAITTLHGDVVSAPGLDNKAGLWVACEAFRRCAAHDPGVALHLVSTVQEEVGLRGADTATSRISPEVGLAIDVTFAADDPGTDIPTAVPTRLGGGPCISHGPNTNPVVEQLLLAVADREGIAVQPAPSGELEGNDAKQIQRSDGGVATAAIGIPLRNMHTQVEVVDLHDLEQAARLVAAFVSAIGPETDFRPFHAPPRRRRASA